MLDTQRESCIGIVLIEMVKVGRYERFTDNLFR